MKKRNQKRNVKKKGIGGGHAKKFLSEVLITSREKGDANLKTRGSLKGPEKNFKSRGGEKGKGGNTRRKKFFSTRHRDNRRRRETERGVQENLTYHNSCACVWGSLELERLGRHMKGEAIKL